MPTAHIVGNSLGGQLALRLASRGRARSVVVLAPAGGWEPKTGPPPEIFEDFERSYAQMKAGYSSLASLVSTPEGRRLATRRFTVNYEHLPADLVLHLLEGVALCEGERLVEYGRRADWGVATQQVSCPTRIVWGRADSILPYPQSALRLQREMPHADWVELDDVGHCPQLDVPLVAAELITNFAGSL